MTTTNNPLSHFQVSTLFNVQDLTCVVTGGSSGLGLYAAHALASNGALVYILGRRQSLLDSTVSDFNRLFPDTSLRNNGELVAVQADITSKTSLISAREFIESDLVKRDRKGVQVLVCNAGIAGKFLRSYGQESSSSSPDTKSQESKDQEFGEIVEELWSFTESDCSSILETNITGNYLSALCFLPLLKEGTSPSYLSQTILISSNAAWSKLPILNPIYNISKTAVSHLGQILSTMFCDHGLRTNVIEPGLYPSDLTSTESRDPVTGHYKLSHTNGANIPIGRCGKPEEHAGAVLYLASRNSMFANGTTMRVDGGALQKVSKTIPSLSKAFPCFCYPFIDRHYSMGFR
ncbi:related to NADPH-dependent beta- ketoacyl reductase [Melanopsichium pennsylvanicum]|uniref:Related to NADPH-dependent beta- ketoacyl reductase n=2 Tax=Melanopsichium pennsylvanicum TaxID=63383 RepID=A0AAJ4XJ09_9BASI|nr:related to NADPH-dependent beta-ketoacyl reductase [Melanopsichium pennsylvanicum 4]SNX82013.1 related to NADPH-dependent beta- ketoacyl reductase [Melanopsichium pennsylvanicum]